MSWTWRFHVHALTLLLQCLCIPEAQNRKKVSHTIHRNHLSGSSVCLGHLQIPRGGGEQEEWASGFHFPALLFSIAASRNSVYFLSVLEHDSLWDPRLNIRVCFNSSTCVFLFLKPSAFHSHGTVTRGDSLPCPSILPLLAGHGAPQKLKHKALDTAVMDTSANIPEKHPSPTPQVLITFNNTCYDSSLQQKEC